MKKIDPKIMFRVLYATRQPVALFAEHITEDGRCACYSALDEARACDYETVIKASRPARPDEYAKLKKELEKRFIITVIQRRPHNAVAK